MLAPSGGSLILYQAYGNLYAMTGLRKPAFVRIAVDISRKTGLCRKDTIGLHSTLLVSLSDNQMSGPLVDGSSENLFVFWWEVVQVILKIRVTEDYLLHIVVPIHGKDFDSDNTQDPHMCPNCAAITFRCVSINVESVSLEPPDSMPPSSSRWTVQVDHPVTMEMIHVKFDELTAMASECNNLKPIMNYTNFSDSSEDSQLVPSKSDLDNLFGPMYKEYYVTSSQEVSDNFAADTLDNKHNSSSLPIVVNKMILLK
nr:hypothetical protein [Tanacetum cinerariifolium]